MRQGASRALSFGVLGLLVIVVVIELYEVFQENNTNVVVLIFLSLVLIVNGFLAVTQLRDFRGIRAQMKSEQQELVAQRAERVQADEELKRRIDKDRRDQLDQEWINTTANSIVTPMSRTVVAEEIFDELVEGIGRTLNADFVFFYSFNEFQNFRVMKLWSEPTSPQIDIARIMKFESSMLGIGKHLVNQTQGVAVNDAHLADIIPQPFPDLVVESNLMARSWALASVGEANNVLGYVWLGMVKEPRIWSAIELGFVKKILVDSFPILAHTWLIDQLIQISVNKAEVDRLVELDKMRNNFIENMNHELRTPLTSIIGYMEVILDDVDADIEPSLASSLTAVQRNAIRLQILIENMMQLAKTDFDILPLTVSAVDIGHLLGDVVNSLQLTAEECEVVVILRLDSPESDLIVDGDINQLEQVFVNLMSNAIKFTRSKGTVTVVARHVNADIDYVEVGVIDTGIGIPPEEFSNMFKRFFRATTAIQASIPGFGIGLSLVHSIIREHHGTITFDSTVGKGTEFIITLPVRYISAKPADVFI